MQKNMYIITGTKSFQAQRSSSKNRSCWSTLWPACGQLRTDGQYRRTTRLQYITDKSLHYFSQRRPASPQLLHRVIMLSRYPELAQIVPHQHRRVRGLSHKGRCS